MGRRQIQHFHKLFTNVKIIEFHYHIWNRHGKYIQISTNMPGIDVADPRSKMLHISQMKCQNYLISLPYLESPWKYIKISINMHTSIGVVSHDIGWNLRVFCTMEPMATLSVNRFHAAGVSRRQQKMSANVKILEFSDYIWNHHEECIQRSTNIPGIGLEILRILRNQMILYGWWNQWLCAQC